MNVNLIIDGRYYAPAGTIHNLARFLETIPVINQTIDYFHQHHWPVVILQHTSPKKSEGSEAWKVYKQFIYSQEDIFLTKTKQNAFAGTLLQEILETQKANQLLLAGYLAEYCVLTTYHAAMLLGYPTYIFQGGTASLNGLIKWEEMDPSVRLIAQPELEILYNSLFD